MSIASLLEKSAFDPDSVVILASAFETAWNTIKASGSPLAAEGQAQSTRELLAKRIIETAQTGERNPRRLVDDALAYVTARK
ncbi:MAG: hypothetical protein QOI12_2819 [Alphaproteobacteria bacterium]|jgi:hypothetical protein|nr:hypothetical protein [Alphaproteobacteria bacterium]